MLGTQEVVSSSLRGEPNRKELFPCFTKQLDYISLHVFIYAQFLAREICSGSEPLVLFKQGTKRRKVAS